MRKRFTGLKLLSLAVAVLSGWICGAEAAWAGDGGASLTTIQAIIGKTDGSTGFCNILGMGTKFGTTCPQLPTVTQAILEAAALGLSPPEMVAAQNSIAPGSNVNAGNAAAVPPPTGTPFPLDATTSPTLSDLLSSLTPLAFENASKSGSTAPATQLFDTNAQTFLYAVAVSSYGISLAPGGTVPDTLLLFYDDLPRISPIFLRGQTVAKFSLPLTVLNSDGTERAVSTTLKFIAPTTDCSASKITGDFMGSGTPQTVPVADITGLNCAIVFGSSPASRQRHAIFEVAIPLVVTGANPPPLNTDPAYFYSYLNPGKAGPINTGLFTAFALFDDIFGTPGPGAPPNFLGATGIAIGVAPTAGPLGPPPATGVSSTYALCASLPWIGIAPTLVPAVGAYYAIATDGEALLSAALPGVSTSVCPRL